jgi:hypothetical protein
MCGRGALYERHIEPTLSIVLQAPNGLKDFRFYNE